MHREKISALQTGAEATVEEQAAAAIL